jgi:hypothetical protein
MTMFMKIGIVTLAILGSASAIPAQTTAPDPWKKVPALPTTYFRDLDFSKKLGELRTEIVEEQRKQFEINNDIEAQYGKMDMMEISRRMQAYMAKDPQKAMKMMQAQAAAASAIKSDIVSGDEAKTERNAELEKLKDEYKADMEAVARPFRAKREEIRKTGTVRVVEHGSGPSWAFQTKEAETAYNEQVDKENAEISARSVAWFGPSGKFTAWLASYRETVLVPNAKAVEANDEIKAAQMAIMETPTAAYRSTAQMTAVSEYLEVMRKVYELRIGKEENVHRTV